MFGEPIVLPGPVRGTHLQLLLLLREHILLVLGVLDEHPRQLAPVLQLGRQPPVVLGQQQTRLVHRLRQPLRSLFVCVQKCWVI